MSDEREALKPCPFCGGTDLVEMEACADHWIKCASCNAMTDVRPNEDSARETWNRRPQPAPDAGLAIPEGCVLVPVEITEDMADAMECEFSTEGQWKAALAARPPVEGDGWRLIESAPKDGTPFLVFWPNAYQAKGGVFVALYQDGVLYTVPGAYKPSGVTHWMPLPAPPAPRRK